MQTNETGDHTSKPLDISTCTIEDVQAILDKDPELNELLKRIFNEFLRQLRQRPEMPIGDNMVVTMASGDFVRSMLKTYKMGAASTVVHREHTLRQRLHERLFNPN